MFVLKVRILLLSFFVLTFGGCKGKELPFPVIEFSADAVVSVNDSLDSRSEFRAQVVSVAPGVLSVTITNPQELSGLSCRWGDGFEMWYNDLCVKEEAAYLPDFSFQRVIYDVFEDLSKNPQCVTFVDGIAVFEGDIPAGKYRAHTDDEGNIQQISVKEINLKIEFLYKE